VIFQSIKLWFSSKGILDRFFLRVYADPALSYLIFDPFWWEFKPNH